MLTEPSATAQPLVPTFKNEIAPDLSQPPAQQQPQLEKDRESLEERIDKFEERIETLSRLLARSSESRMHNKVNELQEELSQRRFDLYVAQIHLSAVRSQLQLFEYNFRPASVAHQTAGDLFAAEHLGAGDKVHRRSPSGASAPLGYRHKWIKAFKSLKETPASSGQSQR